MLSLREIYVWSVREIYVLEDGREESRGNPCGLFTGSVDIVTFCDGERCCGEIKLIFTVLMQ